MNALASALAPVLVPAMKPFLTASNPPTPTPSAVATQMLESIRSGGRDSILPEMKNRDAVLTEAQREAAQRCDSEGILVQYLTPFLQRILERDGMCVVNSEDFPWLKTTGAPQKPDLFLTSPWCYETRIPGKKIAWKHREGYRFGVIADSRLYDNVYLSYSRLSAITPNR